MSTTAKPKTEPARRGRPRQAMKIDKRTAPKNLDDGTLLERAIQVTRDPVTETAITDQRFAELVLMCHPRTLRKYRSGRALNGLQREKLEQLISRGGVI